MSLVAAAAVPVMVSLTFEQPALFPSEFGDKQDQFQADNCEHILKLTETGTQLARASLKKISTEIGAQLAKTFPGTRCPDQLVPRDRRQT